jgi:ABC-type antimicrobial peptide transport system permease subunit
MNWNQHFNKADFEYAFYDETISRFYEAEKRTAKLLKVATAIALIISCLGLFGLATFMAERRRKEIGIRKVLGATISGIVLLLSQDIIKLILVALLVATPISMYFANDWLNSFADHISVSSWIFATTGVFALFVALITVGFQGFRAAVANPVDSLKNE